MIILNGKKFAKNDTEFVDSLFQTGGTCDGFYKANKKSIHLMNMQGERIATINKYGAGRAYNPKNKTYSFATIDIIGEYKSYSRGKEEFRRAYEQVTGNAPEIDTRGF